MSDSAERTIPATPRRRELARRRGLMPLASLPAWVASTGTTLLLLPAWARVALPAATTMMERSLAAAMDHTVAPARLELLLPAAVLLPTVALVAVAGAVGLTVRVLVDGSRWQLARALPTLDRVNLLAGLTRIFSTATLVSLVGHAGGLALLVAVAVLSAGPLVAIVGAGEPADEPARVSAAAHRALVPLVAAAAAVAACTWVVSRLRFERRIRMTPKEHADEARSMEADPKVRLLQRQRRRTA